ncbi:hypothetical protein [Thiofilum flexile]|uniref:hypothetical protein n=1 Tax=Thiofilum flexile TaxID=125627 RepID=UPI00036FF0F9|nr:hypothetical protein [Thiofilum flexile]
MNPNTYLNALGELITPEHFESIDSGYFYLNGQKQPCERYLINNEGDGETIWLADIAGHDCLVEVCEGEEFEEVAA